MNHNAKAGAAVDDAGNVLGRYPTATAAAKAHFTCATAVVKRCKGKAGKRKTGLNFRYAEGVKDA